jgi:hypothetical protein
VNPDGNSWGRISGRRECDAVPICVWVQELVFMCAQNDRQHIWRRTQGILKAPRHPELVERLRHHFALLQRCNITLKPQEVSAA